jgi:hypothetical protein
MTSMVIQSWTGKRLGSFGSSPDLPTMQFVWRPDLYRGSTTRRPAAACAPSTASGWSTSPTPARP